MNLLRYLGHFHPLAVHLPIGIWSLILLLFIFVGRSKLQQTMSIMKAMALICALAATASVISGYLLSTGGEYEPGQLTTHQYLAYGFTLACWLAYLRLPYLFSCKPHLYRLWLMAGAALMILTGHAGGTLTHGEGFMLPPPASTWFDDAEEHRLITSDMTTEEVVQIILNEKCVSCHGPRKQKGDLRLDSKENILKGGKDGKIVANAPEHSLLIKNILLPEDDDKHMPPKGRKQLTKNEIAFLTFWIMLGDDKTKTLAELPLPDSLASILSPKDIWKNEMIPEKPVQAPDEKVVNQLRALHVVVNQMGQSSNYLQVSFVNVLPESTDRAIALLPGVKRQLIELHLDDQKLNDASWEAIGKLSALRKITLRNTNLDDQKLPFFHELKNLKVLNLSGTHVSAAELEVNIKSDSLSRIYLYQTGIDRDGSLSLQSHFPNTRLDTGNYRVPVLQGDTTVFTKKDLEDLKKRKLLNGS